MGHPLSCLLLKEVSLTNQESVKYLCNTSYCSVIPRKSKFFYRLLTLSNAKAEYPVSRIILSNPPKGINSFTVYVIPQIEHIITKSSMPRCDIPISYTSGKHIQNRISTFDGSFFLHVNLTTDISRRLIN